MASVHRVAPELARHKGVEDVYRTALPQLSDEVFLTDSGLETDLIFHGGFDLPEFAAFVLVDDAHGTAALDAYFRRHVDIAVQHGCGVILEAPTWRASRDWGSRIGYPPARNCAGPTSPLSVCCRGCAATIWMQQAHLW